MFVSSHLNAQNGKSPPGLARVNTNGINWINFSQKNNTNGIRSQKIKQRAVVIKIITWLMAFGGWSISFFEIEQLPLLKSSFRLISISICASILGTLLRGIVRDLGLRTEEYTAGNSWLEGLMGVILAFIFFLLFQLVNLFLTGKSIQIENMSDIQRIGIGLSALSFLTSLFLERGWHRLSEYMEKLRRILF